MTAGWSYYIEFRGQRIPLTEGTLTLGRSRYCDISLDDPSISRKHIQLKIEAGRVQLIDLGSSNGTVVNGQRIPETTDLASGDLMRMGDAEIRLIIEAPLFDDLVEEPEALKTVRLPATPQAPGEATFFLQKASVELAQQAHSQLHPEPVQESPFAAVSNPTPPAQASAQAVPTSQPVLATQALPSISPVPSVPASDQIETADQPIMVESESFADLLADPQPPTPDQAPKVETEHKPAPKTVDIANSSPSASSELLAFDSPEFDEATPFTFDLDAPSPFEVSPPADLKSGDDASFADLDEPVSPWAPKSEPPSEPIDSASAATASQVREDASAFPPMADAPTIPDIEIDFSNLEIASAGSPIPQAKAVSLTGAVPHTEETAPHKEMVSQTEKISLEASAPPAKMPIPQDLPTPHFRPEAGPLNSASQLPSSMDPASPGNLDAPPPLAPAMLPVPESPPAVAPPLSPWEVSSTASATAPTDDKAARPHDVLSLDSELREPPTVPSLTDAMAEGPLSVKRGTRSQDILPTLDSLESAIGPQMPELPAPQPPPAEAPVAYSPSPAQQLKPAGFWRRTLAMMLDSLWIIALFLGASLTWEGPFDPRGRMIGLLVAAGLSFIVILIGWSFWGTTPGKRMARLYICGADRQPGIGVGRTLLRLAGYALSGALLGVGFILIAFHPEKKGLHDLISGTQVLGT